MYTLCHTPLAAMKCLLTVAAASTHCLSFCPVPVGSFKLAFDTSMSRLDFVHTHFASACFSSTAWSVPLEAAEGHHSVRSNLHKTQPHIPSYSSSSSSSSGMIMFIRHNTSVAWPAPWFRFKPGTCSCTGACCNTPTHTDCNFLPLNTPQSITATRPSAQNRYKYAHIAHTQNFR